MARIVIAEFMDEDAVGHLGSFHDVHFDPTLVDAPVKLLDYVKDADALIVRNRTRVTGEMIAAGPRLRCIGRLGVGLDNIDVDVCRERGIAVFPATGANDVSVAEYVIGTMLVLLRRAYEATPAVVDGSWPRLALIGREASGRRMGLVGFGATAREVAKRAAAFGMQVRAFDPHLPASAEVWSLAARVELADILSTSDVISVHVPLNDSTRRLMDLAAFNKMKPGAIFINASRGGVVDESALASVLREHRIGGAAMDVFEQEPLSSQAGKIFAGLNNLILTPHIAGLTEESNVRVSWMVARKIEEALKELPASATRSKAEPRSATA